MIKKGDPESRWQLLDNIITQNFPQLDFTDFISQLHCSTLVLLLHWRLLLVTAALFTSLTWLQDCYFSAVRFTARLLSQHSIPARTRTSNITEADPITVKSFFLCSTSLLLFTAAYTMTEAGSEFVWQQQSMFRSAYFCVIWNCSTFTTYFRSCLHQHNQYS